MKRKILTIAAIITIGFLSTSITFPHKKRDRFREERVLVEEWMTKSFDTVFEEPLEVEDWMTKPFITN